MAKKTAKELEQQLSDLKLKVEEIGDEIKKNSSSDLPEIFQDKKLICMLQKLKKITLIGGYVQRLQNSSLMPESEEDSYKSEPDKNIWTHFDENQFPSTHLGRHIIQNNKEKIYAEIKDLKYKFAQHLTEFPPNLEILKVSHGYSYTEKGAYNIRVWSLVLRLTILSLEARHLFKTQTDEISPDNLDAEPMIKVCDPIDVLCQAYSKRFWFHFSGNRPTNRIDKPEWYLSQVLRWLKEKKESLNALTVQFKHHLVHTKTKLSHDQLSKFSYLQEFVIGLLSSCVRIKVRKHFNKLVKRIDKQSDQIDKLDDNVANESGEIKSENSSSGNMIDVPSTRWNSYELKATNSHVSLSHLMQEVFEFDKALNNVIGVDFEDIRVWLDINGVSSSLAFFRTSDIITRNPELYQKWFNAETIMSHRQMDSIMSFVKNDQDKIKLGPWTKHYGDGLLRIDQDPHQASRSSVLLLDLLERLAAIIKSELAPELSLDFLNLQLELVDRYLQHIDRDIYLPLLETIEESGISNVFSESSSNNLTTGLLNFGFSKSSQWAPFGRELDRLAERNHEGLSDLVFSSCGLANHSESQFDADKTDDWTLMWPWVWFITRLVCSLDYVSRILSKWEYDEAYLELRENRMKSCFESKVEESSSLKDKIMENLLAPLLASYAAYSTNSGLRAFARMKNWNISDEEISGGDKESSEIQSFNTENPPLILLKFPSFTYNIMRNVKLNLPHRKHTSLVDGDALPELWCPDYTRLMQFVLHKIDYLIAKESCRKSEFSKSGIFYYESSLVKAFEPFLYDINAQISGNGTLDSDISSNSGIFATLFPNTVEEIQRKKELLV